MNATEKPANIVHAARAFLIVEGFMHWLRWVALLQVLTVIVLVIVVLTLRTWPACR